MNTTDIREAVAAELRRIEIPELAFHSDHEGWAVLLEEVEETADEMIGIKDATEELKNLVFADCCFNDRKISVLVDIIDCAINCAAEAVQVAAVGAKFMRTKGADYEQLL